MKLIATIRATAVGLIMFTLIVLATSPRIAKIEQLLAERAANKCYRIDPKQSAQLMKFKEVSQ